MKEALAAREALAAEEPGNVRHRLDAGWTRLALGTLHWKALRLDRADREWTAALRDMEAALRDEPDDSPARDELDNARFDVADKLLQLGLWEEAGELLDRVFRRNPANLAQDGHYWHIHAMLRLLAGDSAGFRAVAPSSSSSSRMSTASSTSIGPAGGPGRPGGPQGPGRRRWRGPGAQPRDNWYILPWG